MKFMRMVLFCFLAVLLASSAEAQRRRVVAHPAPPVHPTMGTTLSVWVDETGTRVAFSAWFPVPAGTKIVISAITPSDGFEMVMVTHEMDVEHDGWGVSGWIVGNPISGEPTPHRALAFVARFTHPTNPPFEVYAKVPTKEDPSPGPVRTLTVWPGQVMVTGEFKSPVASIWGKGCPVIGGWVVSPEEFLGVKSPVTVCDGYPRSVCSTWVGVIPSAE